jgi:hypothetical protein
MPNEPLMLPTFDADDPRHLAWPDQMPRSSDHSPLESKAVIAEGMIVFI